MIPWVWGTHGVPRHPWGTHEALEEPGGRPERARSLGGLGGEPIGAHEAPMNVPMVRGDVQDAPGEACGSGKA